MEDLDVNGGLLLNWILIKQDREVRSGFVWLRGGTNDGPFRTR
jgi:hypothetical protein